MRRLVLCSFHDNKTKSDFSLLLQDTKRVKENVWGPDFEYKIEQNIIFFNEFLHISNIFYIKINAKKKKLSPEQVVRNDVHSNNLFYLLCTFYGRNQK